MYQKIAILLLALALPLSTSSSQPSPTTAPSAVTDPHSAFAQSSSQPSVLSNQLEVTRSERGLQSQAESDETPSVQTAISSLLSTNADFYVSPTGNDTNTGTVDKPFATILQARNAVRKLISAGLTSDLSVLIRGGTYELAQPLTFDPQDSGSDKHSITYAAYPGETPVISGATRITGWQQENSGLWTTEIPRAMTGTDIRHLFVNGRRALRPRHPNANLKDPFLRIKEAKLDEQLQTWEVTLPPEAVAPWKNLSDVELVVLTEWDMVRKRLQNVEPTTGRVSLLPPHLKPRLPVYCPRPGYACYLENARAFLNEPGEWYLDNSTRQLCYWPRAGESLDTVAAYTPVLTNLVSIQGAPGRPVRNLHLDGLSLAYTTWPLPDVGYMGNCVNGGKPAAILMVGCENCSILNCQIGHLGGDGIQISHPNQQLLIQGNRLHDISGHGIVLTGAGPTTPPILGGAILNNEVYDCGVEFLGCHGIQAMTYSGGLRISHNLVHDVPYIGISLGRRDSNPAFCSNNEISYNRVEHTMKLLSDGGGIYEIGPQSNCLIKGNYITDVMRSSAASGAPNNGIFMDDHGAGCVIFDNVVVKTSGAPLRFNCDRTKHITGENYFGENAFYKGKVGQYSRSFSNDRFMDLPHAPTLDPQHLTIETWIRPLTFAGGTDPSYWLVSKNGSELADGHYSLLMSHNNIGAYLNIGGGRENCYAAWSQTGPLRSNEWSHVAMTYDGASLQVFCDGKLVGKTEVRSLRIADRGQRTENSDQRSAISSQQSASSDLTSDLRPPTSGTSSGLQSPVSGLQSGIPRTSGAGTLRIGKRADGYNKSFDGLMDDVRIYSRALSPDEISTQFSVISNQSGGPGSTMAAAINPQLAASPIPSSPLSTDNRQLKTTPPHGLVFRLDFTAMHDQMQKIIAAAGPEEPYRSRFARVTRDQRTEDRGQKLAPPQAESEVAPEGRAPARPPPSPVSEQKP